MFRMRKKMATVARPRSGPQRVAGCRCKTPVRYKGQMYASPLHLADCCTKDKVLIDAVQKLGRHWKDIQRHHFKGRSKNCIKNRYESLSPTVESANMMLPATLSSFAVTRIKASRCPSQRAHPSRGPTQPQMTRTCLTTRAYTTIYYLPAPKCRRLKHSTLGQQTVLTQGGLHKNPSTL